MAKKGRKPEYVRDDNGVEVHGLSRTVWARDAHGTPTAYRYFTTHDGKKQWFGTDRDLAIVRFRQWESGASAPISPVEVANLTGAEQWEANRRLIQWAREHPEQFVIFEGFNPETMAEYTLAVPADVFWDRVRDLFFDNPASFARNMRVPAMADLDHLKRPAPPIALSAVWDTYLSRKKRPSMQTRSDNQRYWNAFVKATGATTVADITPDVVARYNDEIHARHRGQPVTIRHSFSLVKSVFAHAATKGKDLDRLKNVMLLLGGLEFPEKPGPNPLTMTPEHFRLWLDNADLKHKAILLLLLNAAAKPQYVASLRWNNADGSRSVDLDSGTVVARRGKRGKVVCCCRLWPRTIKAIRDWMEAEPHNQPTVFVNDVGAPYASGRILAHGLRVIRDRAGIPKSVKIKHIRSGAITACVASRIPQRDIMILSGHATGTQDWYAQRAAYLVEDACAAIERHYFSG